MPGWRSTSVCIRPTRTNHQRYVKMAIGGGDGPDDHGGDEVGPDLGGSTVPKDKTVSRRELVKETWITECRKSWFESHDRGMRHPRRVIRKTIFTDNFSLLRSSLFCR